MLLYGIETAASSSTPNLWREDIPFGLKTIDTNSRYDVNNKTLVPKFWGSKRSSTD